jgi:hypothetical protein
MTGFIVYISIPADRRQLAIQFIRIKTGGSPGEEQGNLSIFFLAFSFSDGARHTCTIPTGKAIVIPVNVVEVSLDTDCLEFDVVN